MHTRLRRKNNITNLLRDIRGKKCLVISSKDTEFYIKIVLTNLSRLCQSTYLYAFICTKINNIIIIFTCAYIVYRAIKSRNNFYCRNKIIQNELLESYIRDALVYILNSNFRIETCFLLEFVASNKSIVF